MKTKKKGGGSPSPFFNSKWVFWALVAVGLAFAYLQKTPCFTGSWGAPESVQYRKLCYSDIQALYGYRGLDQRKIPYVEQKPFEYPPLIGWQMYVAALFSRDHVSFFKVNALFNTFWALLTFYTLLSLIGYRRNFLWLLIAPPFLFYLHINWDISTLAFLSLSIVFWKRQRLVWTGVFLGVGFTGKMFPVFAIPFLMLELFRKGDAFKKHATHLLVGTAVGILIPNLPTLILDRYLNGSLSAVFSVFGFHLGRTPDFGTFWYWVGEGLGFNPTSQGFTKFVDASFLVGMMGMLFILLRKQWKRTFEVWTGATVMTATCLLLAKVHSLQYSLWMLPFFVLHRGFLRSKLFYLSMDLIVFVFGFWWYGNFSESESALYKDLFKLGVLGRAVALFFLIYGLTAKRSQLVSADV